MIAYVTDAEYNRATLAMLGCFVTIGVLGFMWERHKKYRDFYRRRNHPSMRNNKKG